MILRSKDIIYTPYLVDSIYITLLFMRPIEITKIYLDLVRFLCNNVFNSLLNYIQYKLDFIRHIDIAFKTNISYYFCYILVANT